MNGEIVDEIPIPRAALPDCEACDKPELDDGSYEAVLLYSYCINQQTWDVGRGDRLGLRMEAVIACLNFLHERGRIIDVDRAFDRVWIIDEVVNEGKKAPKDPDSSKTDDDE